VLERFTITARYEGGRVLVVALDRWPLLLVRPATGEVALNDLRRAHAFAERLVVPELMEGGASLRVVEAGPGALSVQVGFAHLATVRPDPARGSHAEVVVEDPTSGNVLLDVAVRYRQVPLDNGGLPGPSLFPG
jgi:hypothetical protein